MVMEKDPIYRRTNMNSTVGSIAFGGKRLRKNTRKRHKHEIRLLDPFMGNEVGS
jgi:hypothetical protein